MKLNIEDITMKVKVVDVGKLKAIISLDFGEFIVKGFRVQTSEYPNAKGDKLWVTPPAYASKFGKYHPIFFMPNKEQWEQLQQKIWDEYYKQRDTHHRKMYDLPVEEENDEIESPF